MFLDGFIMTQISDDQYPKVYADTGNDWRPCKFYSVIFAPGGPFYWPVQGVLRRIPFVTEETIGKTALIFESRLTDSAEVGRLLQEWSTWPRERSLA